MNLLIVDDEELTREGLLGSIDWNSLGIHNIYQADDGMNGLALAKKYRPEIILSDVRMPRMNGIEMAEKIRETVPDSHIIFMSGYSDKEYLKAAIRLKAISYVEKPLMPAEVEEAIREAISSDKILKLSRDSASRHLQEASGKLALKVTYPISDEGISSIEKDFAALGIQTRPSAYFVTVMIKIVGGMHSLENEHQENLPASLGAIIGQHRLHGIYASKQDEYLIYHIFSPEKPASSQMRKLAEAFSVCLSFCPCFYIAIGKTVSGPAKIFDSYNSAVILLQSSFFYECGTILETGKEPANKVPGFLEAVVPAIHEALSSKNRQETDNAAAKLYASLAGSRSVLPNHAKDLYYKLFMELYEAASANYIKLPETDGSFETILDHISRSSNLSSLHQLLRSKIELFFTALEEGTEKNSTVFLIEDYIGRNYQNENLSVKDISEHVFLSSTYVCTVFKNETGRTLNQYLTEYRMEKAKKLLLDPRYKITDISAKVGYSDGNYFGKTFKKHTGLSPSEYREQNVK